MTREEVKGMFPDATEEQVSAILNSHHAEIAKVKKNVSDDELNSLKEKAKLYDSAQAEKLSAEEKLAKAIEEAEKSKVENRKLLNRTKATLAFSQAGVKEEQFNDLLDGIVSDNEEMTISLASNIIKAIQSTKETALAAAKEELMSSTPPPVSTPSAGNDLTLQEKYAAAQKSGDILGMIRSADEIAAATVTK